MDRVRLGRVLGRGARLAARTAMEAVDAASAPAPKQQASAQPRTISIETPRRAAQPHISFAAAALRPALDAARTGVTAPLRRASRALWHELTGSFFALFAFSFSVGLWHSRANAFSNVAADKHRFYAFAALALLFAYFAVSSFVRARRVSR